VEDLRQIIGGSNNLGISNDNRGGGKAPGPMRAVEGPPNRSECLETWKKRHRVEIGSSGGDLRRNELRKGKKGCRGGEVAVCLNIWAKSEEGGRDQRRLKPFNGNPGVSLID